MKHRLHQSQSGFSLIELLVVVALMAILLSLAVPAMQSVISRSAMRGISGDFTLALQRARSEAINRNMCVAVCMSSTANAAAPKCTTSGTNWGIGWVAFQLPSCGSVTASDPSPPPSPNPYPQTNETIVFIRDGFSDRYQLNTQSSADRAIVFGPKGNATSGPAKFNLVDTSVSSNDPIHRTFCVDMAGRVRTLDFGSNC
jgi:type IV fimbrial biogenesis protein FimT